MSVLVALLAAGLPAALHGADSGGIPADQEALEPAEDGQFSRQILWTETWDGRQTALFLPEQVLRETPLDSLPLSEAARHALWLELHGHEEFREMLLEVKGIEVPECARPRGRQLIPHEPTTLEREIVEYSTFGFTGEVVEVITGWDTGLRQAVEVIYVRVDAILHDPDARLFEGEVLGFLQLAGEMTIGDRKICTTPHPDQYLARRGDRLLVAGGPSANVNWLIHADIRLPVRDAVIQPVPTATPTLLPMEPTPLHELEARVADLRDEVQ